VSDWDVTLREPEAGSKFAAREALGEGAFESAFSDGRAMTREQAIEYALSEDPSSASEIAGTLHSEAHESLTIDV